MIYRFIYTESVRILNIILFIRSRMDTTDHNAKKDVKATSKDKQLQSKLCLISGKSLNVSTSSKNGHNESAANRGHVSEVIVCSTADEKSANKSEKAIASL